MRKMYDPILGWKPYEPWSLERRKAASKRMKRLIKLKRRREAMANFKKYYDVVIRTPAQQLPTILEALEGAATLVSVHPVRDPQSAEPEKAATVVHTHQPRTFRYAEGKRNKGISGRDLMLRVLGTENRAFSNNELINAFTKEKFAGTSVGPILSVLIRDGLVRRVSDGWYTKTGNLTTHLGDALTRAAPAAVD